MTSGEGGRADRVSTSTAPLLRSRPGCFIALGLACGTAFFAHDLPLNFRSGVQLGDPRSGYNWKISFQAPTSTALASPLARLDRKFRCDFNLRLSCSRRRQKNRDSTDNRSLTY